MGLGIGWSRVRDFEGHARAVSDGAQVRSSDSLWRSVCHVRWPTDTWRFFSPCTGADRSFVSCRGGWRVPVPFAALRLAVAGLTAVDGPGWVYREGKADAAWTGWPTVFPARALGTCAGRRVLLVPARGHRAFLLFKGSPGARGCRRSIRQAPNHPKQPNKHTHTPPPTPPPPPTPQAPLMAF